MCEGGSTILKSGRASAVHGSTMNPKHTVSTCIDLVKNRVMGNVCNNSNVIVYLPYQYIVKYFGNTV